MLEDTEHGSWTYLVDLAPQDGRRRTRRRDGFATEVEAAQELAAVLEGELNGAYEERRTTVTDCLREWLATPKEELTVKTYAGYKAYVERNLIPAFGRCRLLDLRPKQIKDWVAAQRKAGRGRATPYRVVSTLRNALNHAVRSWRLKFNPAEHCVPPKPRAEERTCWTPKEAAAFLRHNAEQYADQPADLFEVLLGTGMRRDEVLALHWSDVHLMDRKLFVRRTLSAVDNGDLHFNQPKTEASRAWISLSPRVMIALHHQADLQMAAHPESRLEGLVFAHADGSPLRPQLVLDQLRKRTAELGLPRIGLHDLRHAAASIMIAAGAPSPVRRSCTGPASRRRESPFRT
ncbi:tyrosine recombinase XerC [Kitasatospora sp. NPDC056651]|uniref:site-specific integrase n=1 Tax=Kitasatospora sp. NPDC056651 TaxID=3345892 RepID=UPI00367F9E3A